MSLLLRLALLAAVVTTLQIPFASLPAQSTGASTAAAPSTDVSRCADSTTTADTRIAACRAALAAAPTDATAHAALGTALLDDGELEEALPSLREAVRLAPADARHRHRLAEALFYLDHNEEAVKEYRAAVRLEPSFARAHMDLGAALAYLDRDEDALRSFDAAIAADTAMIEAYEAKAMLLADLDRLEEALAVWRALSASRPDHADAHYGAGMVLMELERLPEAVTSYRNAVRLAPGEAANHNDLGVALQTMGELEEALTAYRKAHELEPDDELYLGNILTTLIQLQRPGEAVAMATERAARMPTAVNYHMLSSVHLALGQGDSAIAAARTAVQQDSTFAPAHIAIAITLMQQGRMPDALAAAVALTRIVPREARGWAIAGLAALAADQPADAVAHLTQARSLDPRLFQEQPMLGQALEQALTEVAKKPPPTPPDGR